MSHSMNSLPLDQIATFEGNPKKHDLDDLTDSLETFGYIAPIIVNSENKQILAGHGRLDALKRLRDTGELPPDGIDHDWYIPVIDVSLDPELHEAYIVRDNKSTERGGWDNGLLKAILERQHDLGLLNATGYKDSEFAKMMKGSAGLWPEDREWNDGGSLDEYAEEFGVRNGSSFLLGGRHRVLCADSTRPESYGSVRGGLSESLLLADPPYCMASDQHAVHGDKQVVLENDNLDGREYICLIEPMMHHTAADVMYIFCSWERWAEMTHAVTKLNKFKMKTMGIWDKGKQALWNDWGSQHELFAVAYRNGRKKRAATVTSNMFAYPPKHSKLHPTAKPVDLLIEMMAVDIPEGPVLDPFLGSGSTLIACERSNRICLGIEIDPKFVAATLIRAKDAGLSIKKLS